MFCLINSGRLFAIIHCKSVAYATNAEKMIVNVELKLTVQLSHFSSHTFELLVINPLSVEVFGKDSSEQKKSIGSV